MNNTKVESFDEEMKLFQYLSSIPMSNSRIENYRKCPRSYYRSYVLREAASASIPMRMGSILHSALETYVGTQSKSIDDLMIILEGAIFQNESHEGVLEEEDKESIRTVAFEYFEDLDKQQTPIGVEVPWVYYIGPAMFRGVIDKITIIQDSPLTVLCTDYKSSKKAIPQKDMPLNNQMGLYSMVLKEQMPTAIIVACLDYIKLGTKVKHVYTDDELNHLKKNILQTINDIINDNDYSPLSFKDRNSMVTCAFCGHSNQCPVGKRQLKTWNAIQARNKAKRTNG